MSSTMVPTNMAEHRITQYASNFLAKQALPDGAVFDKIELTGLRTFNATTKFTVKDDSFKKRLGNQLKATDCPEQTIAAILDDIECVEDEMSIQMNCKVNGEEGFLYKIAYCLSREDNKAKFAMLVFGASFNAQCFERYEETIEPLWEEREEVICEGWFWWKKTCTRTVKHKIGEKKTKTPKFKGMTDGDLQACMTMLEAKACEKVLETSTSSTLPSPTPTPALNDRQLALCQQGALGGIAGIGCSIVGVLCFVMKMKSSPPLKDSSVFNVNFVQTTVKAFMNRMA